MTPMRTANILRNTRRGQSRHEDSALGVQAPSAPKTGQASERAAHSFTLVFAGDLRKVEGNPHKIETPYGTPFACGIGNAFAVADSMTAALEHIVTVCDDNANVSRPDLALKFVRDIAAKMVERYGRS